MQKVDQPFISLYSNKRKKNIYMESHHRHGPAVARFVESLEARGAPKPDPSEAITGEGISRVVDEIRGEFSKDDGATLETRIRAGLVWAAEQLDEKEPGI